MGARRIVEPTEEPITLEEARAHVQIVETWQDPRLTDAIRGARDQVERYCQRALLTQTWELRVGVPMAAGIGTARLGAGWGRPGVTESHADDFTRNLVTSRDGSPAAALVTTWRHAPGGVLTLPWAAPLQTISGVWVDGILLAVDAYAVDDAVEPAQLWLADTGEFVRVEYICGALDPVAVPPSLKEAVYVLMATAFAWREAGGNEPTRDITQFPLAVQQRLDPFALATLT